VMPWDKLGMGSGLKYSGPANIGEGIQITGPGNVICYNRVKGYRDCISTMEGLHVHRQVCIDIYNNDVYVGADDGIEADFCQGNCRVMRNRMTNCFMGLSSQPGLGGPTYFIRNVMYNIIYSPFKLSRSSKGDVVLNNTVVKVGAGLRIVHDPSLVFFRNNLTIGGVGAGEYGRYDSGQPMAFDFRRWNQTCDMDYDGVGVHGAPFSANVRGKVYYSFDQFRKQAGEKHAVLVDMSVFQAKVEFPNPPLPEREPADLRLRPGSAAVDAGVEIPNITDGYSGGAPDLGAYELGEDVPHYGPRPRGVDEKTIREK
ncbi:MAG: right-handed parallel beta-helix repeat-containing protein, partial [Gemmatimonadota bacterium]|nr:right-handed parallel beta-helix repeat-containing protein [Gemmatimonadota bacterium]